MKNSITLLAFALFTIVSGCRKDNSAANDKVSPRDFLAAGEYKKLTVEIQYAHGHQPSNEAVENLRNFLNERLNKPNGITIVLNAVPSPGYTTYTLDQVRDIEEANRSRNTKRDEISAYFFFADADYAGNSGSSKVLGIAYESSSMVIFEKTIRDYSGGLTQPSTSALETTVLLHEFGHILGLVNNGTPMTTDHQDEPHGRHCDNTNCLMYYTAETSDIVGNLLGGGIPGLDSQCISDLRANGGK